MVADATDIISLFFFTLFYCFNDSIFCLESPSSIFCKVLYMIWVKNGSYAFSSYLIGRLVKSSLGN